MFYNVFAPNRGANEEDFNKEGEQFKEPAAAKQFVPVAKVLAEPGRVEKAVNAWFDGFFVLNLGCVGNAHKVAEVVTLFASARGAWLTGQNYHVHIGLV